MSELQETMRKRRVNAMIADAQFLRSVGSEEAQDVIEIEKRQAMYQFALGRIMQEERDAIFEALNGRNGNVPSEREAAG